MGALEHKGENGDGAQSVAAAANPGTGRRHGPHRIDRDLPLFRGAESGTGAVRHHGALGKALVEMWQRRVELNLFMASPGVSPHPSRNEGLGSAADRPNGARRTSRRRWSSSGNSRQELASREFVAGDLFGRGHHRPDRHRLHETGAHRRAGRTGQCAPLAWGSCQRGRAPAREP
jgi:hypothetical protein